MSSALLVGLGNPGSRYALTRHNMGFMALDVLAESLSTRFDTSKKWQAQIAEAHWKDTSVTLLKPQTYMNLSGESVRAYYQNQPHMRTAPLIVFHDEVDIPFGQLRVKLGGGDAGHNGLKSLRQCLGHGDYYRIRLGVGRPPAGSPLDLADYVLQPFAKNETEALHHCLQRGLDAAELLLQGKLAEAQELAAHTHPPGSH